MVASIVTAMVASIVASVVGGAWPGVVVGLLAPPPALPPTTLRLPLALRRDEIAISLLGDERELALEAARPIWVVAGAGERRIRRRLEPLEDTRGGGVRIEALEGCGARARG